MPFKDQEAAREYRRRHKQAQRAEARRMPLHRRLGINTQVHRQAILHDMIRLPTGKARVAWKKDPVTRVGPQNHLYRVSITLPAL